MMIYPFKLFRFFCFVLLPFLLNGCGSDNSGYVLSPKPRMYPRIEFQNHQFKIYKNKNCGFSFQRSDYSEIVPRTRFFGEELDNDCWFDLNYPDLNTSIHFTYYPVSRPEDFESLVNESFKMVYEHSSVASSIAENKIIRDGIESGMVFRLRGQVASPYQFYITDNTKHFLRGSLYFNSHPNPDSTAPVLDYLLVDMDTLIQSLKWE